jgi:hypothetical protein
MVWSEAPFLASLSPVSTFQRSEAFFPVLMTPDSANTLHVDLALATAPEGPDPAPLRRYGIPAAPQRMNLRMRGLRPEDTDLEAIATTGVPV